MEKEQKGQSMLEFPKEELYEYVERSVASMQKELNKVRNSGTYIRSNPYENLIDHFGLEPEKLVAEFTLINQKKSNQPSAIRKAIKEVVGNAINNLIRTRVKNGIPIELANGVKISRPGQISDMSEVGDVNLPLPENEKKPAKKSRKKKV